MQFVRNSSRYVLKFTTGRLGDVLVGFVFWLPIGIVILVGGYLYSNLENLGKSFLILFLPDDLIHPGFGMLLWVIVLFLTGVVSRNTAIADFLSRVPVLGMLFRRKGGKVISLNRLLNLAPCLFLYSPTCPSYGWILSEENIEVDGGRARFTLVNVYYPNVPSIVTGQIFPVRKETVIKLANPSREIIDLLLYASRSPENIRYLPWEEETVEEFKKRSESFGLKLSTYQP